MNSQAAPEPLEVKRLGSDGLLIVWNDGTQHTITSAALRKNCPSASSRAARGDMSHDTPLSPKRSALQIIEASSADSLHLEKIWSIGNYAIGMRWKDGHDTGIYTYKLLYDIGMATAT